MTGGEWTIGTIIGLAGAGWTILWYYIGYKCGKVGQ